MANIVQTAIQAGMFTTLVTALKAAGLVDTLSGPGPFTVFAPTDDAFQKLPPGTVENLLQNTKQLAQVLTYHVVSGRVAAADIAAQHLRMAKTVEGEELSIDTSVPGKVMIDNATVTKADIACDNGIIHVIDQVLLPPSIREQKAA